MKEMKVKMLPLDYLESIGRYKPLTDHARHKGVRYPSEMISDLKSNAGNVLYAEKARKFTSPGTGHLNHKEYIKVFTSSRQIGWLIPRNWVVSTK